MTTTAEGWAPLAGDPEGSDTHNRYGDAYADMYTDMITTEAGGVGEFILSVGRHAAAIGTNSFTQTGKRDIGVTLWKRDAVSGAYRTVDVDHTFPYVSSSNQHSWAVRPGKVAVAKADYYGTPNLMRIRLFTIENDLLSAPVVLDWNPQTLYTANGGVGTVGLRNAGIALNYTPSGNHLWVVVAGAPSSSTAQSFVAALKIDMTGAIVFEHLLFKADLSIGGSGSSTSDVWDIAQPLGTSENEAVTTLGYRNTAYTNYFYHRSAIRFSELNPAFEQHIFYSGGVTYSTFYSQGGFWLKSGTKFIFPSPQYYWNQVNGTFDYEGRFWMDRDFNIANYWDGTQIDPPQKIWTNAFPIAGESGYMFVDTKKGLGKHTFKYYDNGLTQLSDEPVSSEEYDVAEVPRFNYGHPWSTTNSRGDIHRSNIFVNGGSNFVSMGPVTVDTLSTLEGMPASYGDSAPTMALVNVGISHGSTGPEPPPSKIPEGNWIFTYEPAIHGVPSTIRFESVYMPSTGITNTIDGDEWIYDCTPDGQIQALTFNYTEVGDGQLPPEASGRFVFKAIRDGTADPIYSGGFIVGNATHYAYLLVTTTGIATTLDGSTFDALASFDTTSTHVEYVVNVDSTGNAVVWADGVVVAEFPALLMGYYELAILAGPNTSGSLSAVSITQDIYTPTAGGGGSGSGLNYGVAEIELGGAADMTIDALSHHSIVIGPDQARILDETGRGNPV